MNSNDLGAALELVEQLVPRLPSEDRLAWERSILRLRVLRLRLAFAEADGLDPFAEARRRAREEAA